MSYESRDRRRCLPQVTNHVFEVAWTITPKSTSTSDLWIILPPELRPHTTYGSDWSAFPYVGGFALIWPPNKRGSDQKSPNNEAIATDRPRPEYPRESIDRNRNEDAARAAVRLDAGSPKLLYEGYKIDLSLGRLGTQTTVVQTLGLPFLERWLVAVSARVGWSNLWRGCGTKRAAKPQPLHGLKRADPKGVNRPLGPSGSQPRQLGIGHPALEFPPFNLLQVVPSSMSALGH